MNCEHEDCEKQAVAAWNGRCFCDEHVRERLRTTADSHLKAENERLRTALANLVDDCPTMNAAQAYWEARALLGRSAAPGTAHPCNDAGTALPSREQINAVALECARASAVVRK